MSVPASTAQIRYDDLYARWERGNWRATEIDFSRDRRDWAERMTPEQRRAALWIFSLFFHGEHAVAEELAPFIAAAPRAEQRYFLTTQQVDESRHSIFFMRFLHEVVGAGDGTADGGLRATEAELTWGHRDVFGRLEALTAELRAKPSPQLLARGLTLYHILIEASIAQPGPHVLEEALTELDLLPGLVEGMREVAVDEQRHIGFGVKLLSELLEQDPEGTAAAIVGTVKEAAPGTTTIARPPSWDGFFEPLGFSIEDLYEESMRSLEARLRAIGLPLEEDTGLPMDFDRTPRERAEAIVALLRANLIGSGAEPAQPDGEAMGALFDQMRLAAHPDAVPPGTVIQWDFTDAEPWHIALNPGARAERGAAASPDLRLGVSLQDWVDITQGRASPPALLLRRRLRPRGKLAVLRRLDRVFA